jgi:RNA polymerase sigma factor (sigma-70 family)
VGALTLYTGDPDLALELAQEALARACRDWPRVSVMAWPGAWVHRVAINLANSSFARRRVEQRARSRVTSAGRESDLDMAEAIAVRTGVASLPRRQRTALVLRYFVDLPVVEVAELMGCREGTVKALTSQGIAGLRRTLGHDALLEEVEEVGPCPI